jgi:CHAD domain-containing protein
VTSAGRLPRIDTVLTEFVVDDESGPPSLDAMSEALSARVESRHSERRSWLDTFDWRLHRAGLRLEHHRRPSGHAAFVLTDLDGRRLGSVPAPQTKDVTAADLPEGPIRDQVTAIAGVRTLFVRAVLEGPVAVLSVRNDDDKTVARVRVEGPLAVDGGVSLPPRIRVEALRGYGKDARRVAKRLAAWPGLRTADEPLFVAVCVSHGIQPDVYRAKPETKLDSAMPARLAFAVVLEELLDIARINVDGTLRQLDTEFLHDLRVAVRRSRSALKVAKGVFDERRRARFAAELKWIGDITTPSRDLDVYLLGFDDLVAHANDPEAMLPFRALLTRNCRKAHTALNRALRTKRFARLVEGWPSDLAASDELGPEADTPIERVACDRLRSSWRRVRKLGNAITSASPPEALHDLRKRCKELRYLLEFFASLYQTTEHKEIVGELKRLQDNLGEFQDAESQRSLILHYAEDLAAEGAPAATLVGMGRLDQHFERRQAMARAEFAARWTRFDRKRNRRAFDTMLDAS